MIQETKRRGLGNRNLRTTNYIGIESEFTFWYL